MATTTELNVIVRNMDRAAARAYVADLYTNYVQRIAGLTDANVAFEAENMAAEAGALYEAMLRFGKTELSNVRARLDDATHLNVLCDDGRVNVEQVHRYTDILNAHIAKLRA